MDRDNPRALEPQPITIYLGGPVDQAIDKGRGWREQMGDEVPPLVLLFSPPHAFFNANKQNARALMNINYHVLQACDAALFNLTEPVRAFGSIREIEFALRVNTYVAIVAEPELEESLYTDQLPIFDTPGEALNHIIEVIVDARRVPIQQFLAIGFGPLPGSDDEDE